MKKKIYFQAVPVSDYRIVTIERHDASYYIRAAVGHINRDGTLDEKDAWYEVQDTEGGMEEYATYQEAKSVANELIQAALETESTQTNQ